MELHKVRTTDGVEIALWHKSPRETTPGNISGKHVFLTHGTFSDKKVLSPIADFLSNEGYNCWIMEWRNHGESQKVTDDFDFETIALYDVAAVFAFLFDEIKVPALSSVVHSGGGAIMAMFLLRKQNYIPKVNAMVMFGAQFYGAGLTFKNRMMIRVSQLIAFTLGRLPARWAGARAHDEKAYTMQQWNRANLQQTFQGRDGFDYRAAMKNITFPVLSICGIGDTFIAPPEGCQMFIDDLGGTESQLLIAGKETGFSEDFNHSRLIQSRNAAAETWPKTKEWLEVFA